VAPLQGSQEKPETLRSIWHPTMDVSFSRSVFGASRAAKEAILELVLPPACRLCNGPIAANHEFCRSCELSLTLSEPMMRAACERCGIPKPEMGDHSLEKGFARNADSAPWTPDRLPKCVHCRNMKICFDGVATLWAYQDRVCEAVVAAKYAHHSPLGYALGRRLGDRVKEVFREDYPDWVTYVPSHVTRQLARGGNGNQVIAAAVAKVIRRPCRLLLRTTRRIDKQAWLEDAQRIENVRDAFSVRKSYAFPRSPEIANRHILVVDDVLTTGATANEVAGVLRSGGARRVSLAVVARAVRSP
jgi:predicted amidophosphoribosyltransferase